MASTLGHTAKRLLRQKTFITPCASLHKPSFENNIVKSVFKDVQPINSLITDFIWQNLDRWPDKTATVCAVTGHGYTYAQTHRMSITFAASLRKKLKLQTADTVAIILPNVPEYPVTFLGVLQAGGVASIMNPAFTSYELEHEFKEVDCKLVITSKVSYPSVVEALKKLKVKIPIILIDHDGLPEGAIKFADLAEDLTIDIDCLKAVRRSPDDVAVIPFSSGTTGFPKGVVLTHKAIVTGNVMISDPDIVAINETTATHQAVIPAILPFYHIFGYNVVMMNHMYLGCKLVTMPYFKPDLFINTIANYKANALFVVPPMALFLGKHPLVKPEHLKSVQAIVCGAASLSEDDAKAVVDKNKNIIFRQGYGLTETCGSVSVGANTDKNWRTVGLALGGSEVKITDINTGEALGPGQEGEVWYRGPNLMEGYYKNEAATKEVLTEDGWFKTGDIGKYDEESYLYITDRIKELIKVKGFQVPPAELEAVIRTNPKLADCAVLGIPDEITGEAPKAFVVKQANQTITEEEVKEFVNSKVVSYKKIKEVQFVDVIPKSAAGKILRKDLKSKYC